MFDAEKILSPLLSPLGIALILMVLAFVLSALRRTRTAMGLLLLAVFGLYGLSTPVIADLLARTLEQRFPPRPLADTASADVIVLLGGATQAALPPRQDVELNEHADRIMHAADLYKAGKAGALIASGSNWRAGGQSEAMDMRDVLERFGVPESAVILDEEADNTAENARGAARIIAQRGWRTALLVTSAIHMPRAMAAFERAGVAATASSTDVIDAPSGRWPMLDWLPDAEALVHSNEALHEIAGLAYYRLRGWA